MLIQIETYLKEFVNSSKVGNFLLFFTLTLAELSLLLSTTKNCCCEGKSIFGIGTGDKNPLSSSEEGVSIKEGVLRGARIMRIQLFLVVVGSGKR